MNWRCDRHPDRKLVYLPDPVNGNQWVCVECLYQENLALRRDREAALRFMLDNLTEPAIERLSRLVEEAFPS
jgi:hypothetical protein